MASSQALCAPLRLARSFFVRCLHIAGLRHSAFLCALAHILCAMAQSLRWSVIVRFRPVPGRDHTPRQVSRARLSRKFGPLVVPSAP